jgi:hypothetical protein
MEQVKGRIGRQGEKMAASRDPQQIDEHNWYYEYPTYLLLVHEVRKTDGTHIRTDSVKIHWRKIEISMKRARRTKKPAKR